MPSPYQRAYTRIKGSPVFVGSVAFLLYRIAITAVIALLAFYLPPTPEAAPDREIVHSETEALAQNPVSEYLVLPWFRWDTVDYVSLSIDGYNPDNNNTVWPPLYPFLIKMLNLIVADPVVCALIISNLAAWGFFILLAGYTGRFYDKSLVKETLFWITAFPTAFFLVAGYTESLFLLFALACLFFARNRKWLPAGLFGVLAILTRNQGIVLCLPILVLMVQEHHESAFKLTVSELLKRVIALGMIPMAFMIYVLYVKWIVQAPWPWVALKNGWYIVMRWPWIGLFGNFSTLCIPSHVIVSPIFSRTSDLVLTLLAFFILIKMRRKTYLYELSYAWGSMALMMCKTVGGIVTSSYSRYLLSVYVIFIGLSQIVKGRWSRLALFFFFATSQAILLAYFEMWGFVA